MSTRANEKNTDNIFVKKSISENLQSELLSLLIEIIDLKKMTAFFQPIINLVSGKIIGYEGLIRGPSNSPLHSPIYLFHAARQFGLLMELEQLCRQIVLNTFVQLNLEGKLFLNISPECFLDASFKAEDTLSYIQSLGLNPHRIVIELTESQPILDYRLMLEAVRYYREVGLQVAIDDLGEGFSSLRLWLELMPEYVKIDKHFIQNINQDPVKLQFVKSIQQIAENSDSLIIAEGIETQPEFMIVKDLGIACGQGYFIARPEPVPAVSLSIDVINTLNHRHIHVYPNVCAVSHKTLPVLKLLNMLPPVSADADNAEVFLRFEADPAIEVLPVVNKQGIPLGLINRNQFNECFARPFGRELYRKKSCTLLMEASPLVVDKSTDLCELSNAMVAAGPKHLSNGFIVTDQGVYLGVGTGHGLMREITQMQITAARYANPLTLLPGNVPIDQHIDRLLENQIKFCACYCDLDAFKPFNDVYGYRKGDEIIQITAHVLQQVCDLQRDFVGHIGGDDFIILFQSHDWESRCNTALQIFEHEIRKFFKPDHLARNSYITINRTGQNTVHPLIALSIGAVQIEPGKFNSHHEISAAAAVAKKQAKRTAGNTLFVERRSQ
ncbi:MAG: GGDEF domain-containing protein [Burkholderiales bacterium]|nr:GGDEF domain-containing protein [Burkholderiales bacterium]